MLTINELSTDLYNIRIYSATDNLVVTRWDVRLVGPFAVHTHLDDYRRWVITHLKTGRMLISRGINDMETAIDIAVELVNSGVCWDFGSGPDINDGSNDGIPVDRLDTLLRVVREVKTRYGIY
jgi:hypothetical protein